MVDDDLPAITESTTPPPPGEDGPFAPGQEVDHFKIIADRKYQAPETEERQTDAGHSENHAVQVVEGVDGQSQ